MALQVFASDFIGAGLRIDLSTTDDLYVGPAATIARTDAASYTDFTIVGTGSNHRLDVAGTILGGGIAIEIGDAAADAGNVVNIAVGGNVRSYRSDAIGIQMNGSWNVLTNAGDIWAQGLGVVMYSYDATTAKITNSGTIASEKTGIVRYNSPHVNGTISVMNSGIISGAWNSYDGRDDVAAKDLVTNTGRMIGNVSLGGGDDIYNGTNGRLSGDVIGGHGNDEIRGGVDDEVLHGGEGSDRLYGGSGNDTLNGDTDKDLLDGGVGADTLSGGLGDDTYVVDNPGDKVTENADEGTDLVQAAISHTLGVNVENLTLTGTVKINGTGNSLANVLFGNAADNVLDGKAGADKMQGGKGNDTYIVDNLADAVAEKANEGVDLVKASVNATLSVNVENLTLTGTGNINGTGNALANVIKGTTGINTLKGKAGNDMLYGGTGADKLYGGLGADTFVFMSATDSTVASSGRDTIYDFSRAQGDKINLKAIDASTKSGGDQAFTFIGAEKFHKKAGELRFEKKSGDTFIQGDVNGDGKADFSIVLDLSLTMSKSDFIL